MTKKISVIVSAYNEQDSILDCLSSLVSVDYPLDKYEIIVVNDGSTDNTLKLLKQKQPIDMPEFLLNLKKEKYKINVVPLNDYWIDVGKSNDLSKINSDLDNSF